MAIVSALDHSSTAQRPSDTFAVSLLAAQRGESDGSLRSEQPVAAYPRTAPSPDRGKTASVASSRPSFGASSPAKTSGAMQAGAGMNPGDEKGGIAAHAGGSNAGASIPGRASSGTGASIPARYAASNRKPAYPLLSRRNEEQGTVVLKVLVQADGTAGKVLVKQSSGFPLLDESARSAVENWRFQPASRNNMTVAEWYQVAVPFTLYN